MLYKTTIVIWTEYNPENLELHDLAWEAVGGDGYCSKAKTEEVAIPEDDPDWDRTEFFDLPLEDYGCEEE